MNEEIISKSWVKQLLPIVGVILTVLAFFAKGYQVWVTMTAVSVGGALVLAWLISEAGWIGKAIKLRWFRSKLTKAQADRLGVLLDDITNQLSYAYTLSPLYVWRNCSNDHPRLVKFNDSYFSCVHNWMTDLKDKFNNPGINNIYLLTSMSKAVSETSKLAGFAERELDGFLRMDDITDPKRSRLLKEWDSSRNNFNHWIYKWNDLFKEINRTTNIGCVDYFRPLEMIG
jgi:hypothetical protein